MSEKQARQVRDLTRFDSMSTEELQEILRLDAQKPVGEESDTDEIFEIMEVFARRHKNENSGNLKTIEQAYESFKQNYMPIDNLQDTPKEEQKKTIRFYTHMPRWLRSVAVLVLVIGVFGVVAISAKASVFNLFGMMATWTKDIFHFSGSTDTSEYTEPDQVNTTKYVSLQDALDRFEIEQKLAPAWIPNSYVLTEVEVIDSPMEISFYAEYMKNEEYLQISIRQRMGSDPEQVEKNEDFIEAYIANGITYFLFQNLDRTHAIWIVDDFEGLIAGDLTIDDIKMMIDSI